MESLFIIPPLELSICNSLWKGLFIRLRSKGVLSENGYEFLLAVLLDKTLEAIDPESCPTAINWMKRILPHLLKHPGNMDETHLTSPFETSWQYSYIEQISKKIVAK
jgi:hypothetical protein